MHKWQYNGVAGWTELHKWCRANLPKGEWKSNLFETFEFSTDRAYTWFILKWS